MRYKTPKSVRRYLLTRLYDIFMEDPHAMLSPEDFMGDDGVTRKQLVPNIHYLSDRHLVEMMMGYNPPLFSTVRITTAGIDMVENRFEFNLRFPPDPDGMYEERYVQAPHLIERLMEEAELSALDGDSRYTVLRDIQYLRDELARPDSRWRSEVIRTVIGWIAAFFPEEEQPGSLEQLKSLFTVL